MVQSDVSIVPFAGRMNFSVHVVPASEAGMSKLKTLEIGPPTVPFSEFP